MDFISLMCKHQTIYQDNFFILRAIFNFRLSGNGVNNMQDAFGAGTLHVF